MVHEVIPLGTASAIPTKNRHMSALVLVRPDGMLLFDCGEGAQLRLIQAGMKHSRIDAVFITHLHGDHFFGLMGLLSTMTLLGRERPLVVCGPHGLRDLLLRTPGLAENGEMNVPVTFIELPEDFSGGIVFEAARFTVEARPLDHRIFTVGYRYVEKDRPGRLDVARARDLGITDVHLYRLLKENRSVAAGGRTVRPEEVTGQPRPGVRFAFVTDTRPCENAVALADRVDLLYHEATFTSRHQARAEATGHSTAREAAEIAGRAEASRLLLGHFSARYADPAPLEEEAAAFFQPVEIARELHRYAVNAPADARRIAS